MPHRFFERSMLCIIIGLMVLAMTAPGWGQETRGRINVTVFDPQKAIVPEAVLELVDTATNVTSKGMTTAAGTYTFMGLPVGKYRLTVTKPGFRVAVFDDVTVSATKITDVETTLQVGGTTETVTVQGVTPIVETSSVSIGSTIDIKQIDSLPLQGRDIGQFARMVPGYTGTWNGLPTMAQGNNVDGVISSTSRMKFSGNSSPSVSVRLENIEEMTIQTDQLDMNQGFGMAGMQNSYTTKRGTNQYHGQAFWDHRNDNLNAASWSANRAGTNCHPWPNCYLSEFKLNDFGGSVGGPILKEKLFFFFSLSTARQPGSSSTSRSIPTAAAQAGNFTYTGTDNQTHVVNLFSAAKAYDPALQGTLNSKVAAQLSSINQTLSQGSITTTTDPNTNSLSWNYANATTSWFPTFRVDYTPTAKWRINLAVNQTKRQSPTSNAPTYPGDAYSQYISGTRSNNVSSSLGIDWTATNSILNAFRFGFLYPPSWNPWNEGNWGSQTESIGGTVFSWPNFSYPISTYYPVFTIADTISWQKGKHTLNFGGSAYREQDKYWNTPEPMNISVGMDSGDPAYNALTNAGSYQPLPFATTSQQGSARSLYATLTGRVTGFSQMYKYDKASGAYIQQPLQHFNLNELAKAGGMFIQDQWRFRPNLTINAGFRWDFTASSIDLNDLYHNADLSSIWGPSGVGNLYKPGTLTGNMNPTIDERPKPYNSWNVSPQPSLGIAWSPKFGDGFLKKILGEGNTVIRSSFSYRNFSVPYQYFWNNATDYGAFYYQFATATARNSTGAGSFAPGSLFLGDAYPKFSYDPATYQKSIPAAKFTFNNGQTTNGINGMDANLSQPVTMSWTFNIQQKLGRSRALEVRYSGNHIVHQWLSLNLNEVNVFENGFLQEFKNAQANLAYNATKGVTSFANLYPGAGTVALPIMTAAFTGDKNGSQTSAEFRRSSFITNLNTGAVGSMANTFTTVGAAPYFCNLVGASFAPCATNVGYTGAGAGYPINFFQANPFATGIPATVMTDPAWSNYNALQIDFRQSFWHGLQFDANYTWGHNLGVTSGTDWTGAYTQYTLRNLAESYGPTPFDIRHVFNLSGTYDLPFGSGRMFLNQKGVVDRVVGGWTVGTIMRYQTGGASRITGGYSTFNNLADGGVNLNGVTRQELQDSVGVYKSSANYVSMIDPKYRTVGIGANTQYITSNTTPGTYVGAFYIYGPAALTQCDISVTKDTFVTERTKISFQAQFLNAFNHPAFTGAPGGGVRGTSWGTVTSASNGARVIEFRLRISF